MAFLSAIATGAAGALLGGIQGDMQRKEARKDRTWQKSMSDTSYQRGVADLRAAGLNPMLAYGNAGASSPGGSTAQTPDLASAAEGAASTALSAKRLKQELKNMSADEKVKNDQSDLLQSQKAKVDKETSILGPKSTIMKKLDEGIKASARQIKPIKKKIIDASKNYPGAKNWKLNMKRKP